MPKIRDRVLFLLFCVGLIGIFSCAFLNQAPNRLANGTPLPLFDAPLPEATSAIIGLGLFLPISLVASDRLRFWPSLGAASLLLWASLAGAGHFATDLARESSPAARLSLGPAFWIMASIALLAMLDAAQRARLGVVARLCLGLLLGTAFVVMVAAGTFEDLSLAKEFASHRDQFMVEFWRHLTLVGTAVCCALVAAAPLTRLVLRGTKSRGFIFASLGILQTFPSIALFGLLIAPLSAVTTYLPLLKSFGVSGTGAAPAMIALTLYSLLPLVRGFYTGLAEVAQDVKDAALGMGFDRRRLFFEVELPLALPALVSGLRVVTIQAIGLAAVAALIGAGGLGTFVFQGIGQYALDLVLVGAIPIIGLALAADFVFQMLLSATRSRI